MQSKQELLQTIYAAFNRREADAVLAKMSAEVDWPNGMEGGRVRGHEAVRSYWLRQWDMFDPHVEPVHIEDDETGRTVVEVHQVVRNLAGELLMDSRLEHVYSIRDGLIERMDIVEPESKAWTTEPRQSGS